VILQVWKRDWYLFHWGSDEGAATAATESICPIYTCSWTLSGLSWSHLCSSNGLYG